MNIIRLISTIVEKEMKVRIFKMALTLFMELVLLIFFTYGLFASFFQNVSMSEGLVYVFATGQAWCIFSKKIEAIYKLYLNKSK